MELKDILQLIAAFGLGTIVSTIVQVWVNYVVAKKRLRFDEKKEAYIGLLRAYHRALVEGNDNKTKEFSYWHIRCDLVGSKQVRRSIEEILDTNDPSVREARKKAHDELMIGMRKDLGITI